MFGWLSGVDGMEVWGLLVEYGWKVEEVEPEPGYDEGDFEDEDGLVGRVFDQARLMQCDPT